MTQFPSEERLWDLRKARRRTSVAKRYLHLSPPLSVEASGSTVNLTIVSERPHYFAKDTEFLDALLRPGDVMVDCGANIGQLACFASKRVAPAGVVYAIEAHPTIFRYLRTHTEMNDATNVKLIHAAVGEREGNVTFSDQHADDGNHVVGAGEGLTVPMTTLDALIPDGTKVALLKVDVEGYEKFVFEGGPRVVRDTQCILFESSDLLFGRYGYSCPDVYDLLRSAGFELFRWRGEGVVEKVAAGYRSGILIENLVAVRDRAAFLAKTGFTVR